MTSVIIDPKIIHHLVFFLLFTDTHYILIVCNIIAFDWGCITCYCEYIIHYYFSMATKKKKVVAKKKKVVKKKTHAAVKKAVKKSKAKRK